MNSTSDQREAFDEVLTELAQSDERIVAFSADMGSRIISGFMKKYPDRFYNMGIAEQNMIGVAAGMAHGGYLPYVTTIACFLALRACEQIRTDVAYNNMNVKIIATGGGLSYGILGPTHQGLEDISLMRAVSGLTVVVPADSIQMRQVIRASYSHPGPMYIRIGRGPTPDVYSESFPDFRIGRAIQLRTGSDVGDPCLRLDGRDGLGGCGPSGKRRSFSGGTGYPYGQTSGRRSSAAVGRVHEGLDNYRGQFSHRRFRRSRRGMLGSENIEAAPHRRDSRHVSTDRNQQ